MCLVIVFLMFLLLAVAFTVVPIVAAPNGSLSFWEFGALFGFRHHTNAHLLRCIEQITYDLHAVTSFTPKNCT